MQGPAPQGLLGAGRSCSVGRPSGRASERSAAAAEATQLAIGKVQQQHDAGIEDTKAGEVAREGSGGERPPCRWV